MAKQQGQGASHTTVWSTRAIQQFTDDLDNGIERKDNPYYFGDVHLRKPNLMFEYTRHEIDELVKCKADVKFFSNSYAYTMSPTNGALEQITLRDYQEELLDTIDENRFTIILSSRQSGKTVSSSIYLAWFLLFNYDKTVFVCANKEKTARDVIKKVQDVIMNVPFFMKPGITKWGSLECTFDNGCRLIGESTTERSGIGFTIHCLYLDEFAHVDKNIIEPFYSNIYPTVSSLSDSKIIITSTPNGMNLFYQLYDAATKGINSYKPYRIDWWQVPNWDKKNKCWVKRDQKWMDMMIRDLGGADEELGRERFGAQYGNSFLSTGNLLLGPNALKILEESLEVFNKSDDLWVFDDYDIEEARDIVWKPDFDPSRAKYTNDQFLFSIDIAEGNGGDDSVINIFRMRIMDEDKWNNVISPDSIYDFIGLEQVGIFASNKMHLQKFAKMLYILSHIVFNPDNVKLLLEWNAFGGEVYNHLSNVFGEKNDFDPSVVLKFKRAADRKTAEPGLKLNKDNKLIYCQNTRKHITSGRMILHEPETIGQFNLFGRVGSSYAAITDRDDRAMSCVDANAFFDNRDFKWIADIILEDNPELENKLYKHLYGDDYEPVQEVKPMFGYEHIGNNNPIIPNDTSAVSTHSQLKGMPLHY